MSRQAILFRFAYVELQEWKESDAMLLLRCISSIGAAQR